MLTNQQRTHEGVTRRRYAGEKQREKSSTRIVNSAYHGIDDFLRSYPIATMNRYGERVISGVRIC
jgi:hypothetical protein